MSTDKKSTALVARRGVALDSMDDMVRFCTAAASAGYFKDVRDAQQALMKIQYGAEVGLGPVASLTGIYIVEGRPALASATIASRIKEHPRYDYRIAEHSEKRCELVFFEFNRNGQREEVGRASFSMADAQAASLNGKGVWKKYPRNMLFARALTNGARWYCPDVFSGGVYTVEELEAGMGDIDTIVEVETSAPVVAKPTEDIEDAEFDSGAFVSNEQVGRLLADAVGESDFASHFAIAKDWPLTETQRKAVTAAVKVLKAAPCDPSAVLEPGQIEWFELAESWAPALSEARLEADEGVER